MAKSTKKGAQVGKVTFGKRRVGLHKKHKGPKEANKKEYKGQGR